MELALTALEHVQRGVTHKESERAREIEREHESKRQEAIEREQERTKSQALETLLRYRSFC